MKRRSYSTSSVRQLGDVSPSGQESDTAGTMFNLPGSQGFGSTPTPAVESTFSLHRLRNWKPIPTPEPTIDAIFGAADNHLNGTAGERRLDLWE